MKIVPQKSSLIQQLPRAGISLMILLCSMLTYSGCSSAKNYPPGTLPYKFHVNNSQPLLAAVFDGFGSRIGNYYSLPAGTKDTVLPIGLKSRVMNLYLYDPSLELVGADSASGTSLGELRTPTDIAPAFSYTGVFNRIYVADKANSRLVQYSKKLIPLQYFKFNNFIGISAVREIDPDNLILFSETERAIALAAPTGEVKVNRSRINGKSLGASVRLETTENKNILITDPDNGRVVLLSARFEPIAEYTSAGAAMLSEPVHSAVVNKQLFVLDRGRSALYVLSRSGALVAESIRNEFRECSFILPFDCGIMVFSETGNVLMFTAELDYLKSVQLERSYSAGYVTDGRRILLVSRNDHGIYEYRCNLRKTGERWGEQLPK